MQDQTDREFLEVHPAPVLLQQSHSDEFEQPTRIYKTPAQVGSVLVVGKTVEAH